MDWQQLTAVKGGSGFRYKISIIHMSTRIKYSEIHNDHKSQTLAEFIRRAMDRLPPFYIVFTDNHMAFTMKFTHHPNRKTAFTKHVESLGIIHALIAKGKPWRNGFIERSNRTDKEELFNRIRFKSEEDRKYQLRLWEMYYNSERKHQGINLKTPEQKFKEQHNLYWSIMTMS
ncbi:MAG: integrase core domain-containing protein [Bacteroidia bacterium]